MHLMLSIFLIMKFAFQHLFNSNMIACGQDHTLAIDNEGNVWTFGICNSGQLGIGEAFSKHTVCKPWKLKTLKNIVQVACSDTHSICVEEDGKLWGFGTNSKGELGIGDNPKIVHVPTQIEIVPIFKAECGDNFTICLDKEGFLWSFGTNYSGKLGLGEGITSQSHPKQIPFYQNICDLSVGEDSTLFIDRDNSVFGFGKNNSGKLGLKNSFYFTPTLVSCIPDTIKTIVSGENHTLILLNDGSVLGIGKSDRFGILDPISTNVPIPIPGLQNIKMISCGKNHCMAVNEEGKLFLFGDNFFGQLGTGDEISRDVPWEIPFGSEVILLSKGGSSSIVKELKGTLSAAGKNRYGNLGIWNLYNTNKFVPLRDQFSNLGSKKPIAKKSARK